jgi:hypothetical protein
VLALALFALFVFSLQRGQAGRLMERLGNERRQRITLTEDGIFQSSPSGYSVRYWSAISRVETAEDRLYLYTIFETGHMVPRRAFADEAAWDAFVAAARRYRDRAAAAPGGARRQGDGPAAAPAAFFEKPEGVQGPRTEA